MPNPFFDQPILNSPYVYPSRHWELDESGQPTQKIIDARRKAEFVTPIPKPKKRKNKNPDQLELTLDEGHGLSTGEQQYDTTSVINRVRRLVEESQKLGDSPWVFNALSHTSDTKHGRRENRYYYQVCSFGLPDDRRAGYEGTRFFGVRSSEFTFLAVEGRQRAAYRRAKLRSSIIGSLSLGDTLSPNTGGFLQAVRETDTGAPR